jgi:hypothetical protein
LLCYGSKTWTFFIKQFWTFLARFHIFSRNDRLFIDECDVIARANMENCYQNSSWGKGLIKSRNKRFPICLFLNSVEICLILITKFAKLIQFWQNILQRGRGVKVQNWLHILLKNNAWHRIKTIYSFNCYINKVVGMIRAEIGLKNRQIISVISENTLKVRTSIGVI